jgi:hypothetical protein
MRHAHATEPAEPAPEHIVDVNRHLERNVVVVDRLFVVVAFVRRDRRLDRFAVLIDEIRRRFYQRDIEPEIDAELRDTNPRSIMAREKPLCFQMRSPFACAHAANTA